MFNNQLVFRTVTSVAAAGSGFWFLLQRHPVRSEATGEMTLYEDYARAFSLWKGLGPIISHYRLVEFKQK